jgi:hypothetical protein
MALRKIIDVEGKSIIQTSFGNIQNGTKRVSFSAYVKVIEISGNKTQVVANVSFKSDVQQFNKEYVVPVSVEADSSNFIAQVYEHLKTLEEFAGAIDC